MTEHTIENSDLHGGLGTNINTCTGIWPPNVLLHRSVTLFLEDDMLYWTDGELRIINYCDLNGDNRGILLQDNTQKFVHFDISGDFFYYTALDDQ